MTVRLKRRDFIKIAAFAPLAISFNARTASGAMSASKYHEARYYKKGPASARMVELIPRPYTTPDGGKGAGREACIS